MAKGKASRAVVWVILFLLIVALMGFGATSFTGGQQVVASVGKSEVSAQRYTSALQNDMQALSRQVRQPVTFSQAQAIGLDRQVLSRLIAEAAIENEVSELGLSVGDETVGEEILAVPAFRGPSGDFNRDSYAFTLRENGLTVTEFEERIRAQTSARLLNAAVSAGILTPSAYTSTLFNFARETRDATWAVVGADLISDNLPAPTEADLAAFHQASADLFTRPETRVITYAWLTPALAAEGVDVTDADIQAAYNARESEFNLPERRLVERLVFLNDEQATEAKGRLDRGEITFDALVEERGLSLTDIDLGDVRAEDLGDAGDGVFALDGPGLTEPLPSGISGPAIYRVNAILAPVSTTLDEVRDDLRQTLAEEGAARLIRSQIEEFDDLLVGGATIEELGSETDMVAGQIEVTANAVDADGPLALPEFRNAALSANDNDFAELIEAADGTVFALRLDDVLEPALRPLDEVRAEVEAAFVADQTANAIEEAASTLATEIQNGREMAGLGLALRTDRGVFRDDLDSDLTPPLLSALFQLEPNDVRIIRDGNEVTLIRLDSVTAPDATDPANEASIEAFSQTTAASIAEDIQLYFSQSLIENADLNINTQALTAIHTHIP